MAQVKGTALRGLLKHAKEGGHPGGIAGAVAALPERSRGVFAQKVLASGWYPYRAYADLIEALVGQAPEGMQIANAKLGGIFNMGGAAVANYVSILEPAK